MRLKVCLLSITFGDCCARAASGQVAAALPSSAMNSRRLMASPAPRTLSGYRKDIILDRELCLTARPSGSLVTSAMGQKRKNST